MKKLLLAIASLSFAFSISAQNLDSLQTEERPEKVTPKNVLKLNVFGIFGGSLTGEYERVINKKFSFQAAVGYRYSNLNTLLAISNPDVDVTGIEYTQKGFTVVPQIKYYWTSFSKTLKNPTGAYVAPFFRLGVYEMKLANEPFRYDVDYNRIAVGGGMVMGFQVLAGGSFAIDVFLGPQIKYAYNTEIEYMVISNNRIDPLELNKKQFNTGIRGGITMGFGF